MVAMNEQLHRHGLLPRLLGIGDRLQAGTSCCGPMDQVSVEQASRRAQGLTLDSVIPVASDVGLDVWPASGAIGHRFGKRFPAVRYSASVAAFLRSEDQLHHGKKLPPAPAKAGK